MILKNCGRLVMKKNSLLLNWLLAMAVLLAGALASPTLAAQDSTQAGVPAQMVVTVQPRKGSVMPDISREDVMVHQGRDRRKTLDWVPLQGDRAGLELFLLIDDSSNFSLGSKLDEIKQFIQAQPASTKVGIAYMQNGTARVAQDLTDDHALAGKALRLSLGVGGANASPYFALQDLIKRWPEHNERREVVMITNGADRLWGNKPADTYVDSALDAAQKAGILVYSIYTPSKGRGGRGFGRTNWGQNYLSQMAEGTGAQSYYLGNGAPVSFVPYLDDLAGRLKRQYLLTFQARPEKKAGLQSVKVTTEVPNASLDSAKQVFVPAMPQ
jgi:hypothetical protein